MKNIISLVSFALFLIVLFDLIFLFKRKYIKNSTDKLIYSKSENCPILYYHNPEGFTFSGMPDEIYENAQGELFPVEYKSNLRKTSMPDYFRYQMAAYFLCIEQSYGKNPKYGIMKEITSGREIRIENNAALKKEVLRQAKEITLLKEGKLAAVRNHNDIKKCANCSVRNNCKAPVTGI